MISDNLLNDSGEHLAYTDSLVDSSAKVPIAGVEGIDLAHPDGGEHFARVSSLDFPEAEASIEIKSPDSAHVDTGSVFDDGYSVFDHNDGYSVFDNNDGYSVFDDHESSLFDESSVFFEGLSYQDHVKSDSESNASDPYEDAVREYNRVLKDFEAADAAYKRALDEHKDKIDEHLRYIDSFRADLTSMAESINSKVEQYKPLAEAAKLLEAERDGSVSDAEAKKDVFDREKAEYHAALDRYNDVVREYNSDLKRGTATQSDSQTVLDLKENFEKELKEYQNAEKDCLRAIKVATEMAKFYDALIDKVSPLGREIEKMENAYESHLAEVQVKTAPGWAAYAKLSNKVSGLKVNRDEAKGRFDAATARLEKLALKEKN